MFEQTYRIFREFLRFQIIGPLLRRRNRKIIPYSELIFSSKDLARYDYFCDFAKKIESIPGCFVECGFGLGHSFMALSSLALKQDRKILGFDSFQGFPNLSEFDRAEGNSTKAKFGSWNHTSLEEAERKLVSFGFSDTQRNSIHLEAGFVEDSVPKYLEKNMSFSVALLHIDLDLYEGYKTALNRFWPRMSYGGVVIFDEYGDSKWPGAKMAVDEFAVQRGLVIHRHISGKYFVIKNNL